jgi:metal iron transporter
LTINASILTLAGAAFYYQNSDIDPSDADLFGAHALIKSYIGNAAAVIFALALLCVSFPYLDPPSTADSQAGQSASITCTLAGQVVSEGFLNWRVSVSFQNFSIRATANIQPFLRRIVTRCIGVIPAAIVAAAMGGKGLNTMLVASQVVLSVVLPTVIFPLVYLCSRKDIMTVLGPEIESDTLVSPVLESEERRGEGNEERRETVERRQKSYISPKWVTILGYLLTFVVLMANVYVFVQLGLGN